MTELPYIDRNKTSTDYQWLSVHLHSSVSLSDLLRCVVKPFLDQELDENDQFFFIRYYENGPHIRLRIKAGKERIMQHIKPKLFSKTQELFRERFDAQENFSIQVDQYSPELSRYGGLVGTHLAEKLGQRSSEIVLNLMSSEGWNNKKAFGSALQLNAIVIIHFLPTVSEIQEFLTFAYISWTSVVLEGYRQKNENDSFENVITKQETAYNAVKMQVTMTLKEIADVLYAKGSFSHPKLNLWDATVQMAVTEFKTHHTVILDAISEPDAGQNPLSAPKHWVLVDRYLHLTNNRSGLLYEDESYQYFILKKFFDSIAIN